MKTLRSPFSVFQRFFTLYVATLLAVSLAVAPVQAAEQTPEKLVETTTNRMLQAINENKKELENSPEKLYQLIENIIVPYFDFDVMSQWVMGKNWRQATAEQKAEFRQAFKVLLINTYGSSLLKYSDLKVDVVDQPGKKDPKERTIKSEIHIKNKQPFVIQYSMINSNGQWMVYDVTIEGLSIISNYRTEIAAQIKSQGIDGMIDTIKAKNAEFDLQ